MFILSFSVYDDNIYFLISTVFKLFKDIFNFFSFLLYKYQQNVIRWFKKLENLIQGFP